MNVRTILLSLLAGLVSFLVVGIGVTELLADRIWPSLIVGIPAGLAAGIVGFVAVWYVLRNDSSAPTG